METVTDFIFLGSKITADVDYSHEIKKMLAPWKKSYAAAAAVMHLLPSLSLFLPL